MVRAAVAIECVFESEIITVCTALGLPGARFPELCLYGEGQAAEEEACVDQE